MASRPRLVVQPLRHGDADPSLADLGHMVLYGVEEFLELTVPGLVHDPVLAENAPPPPGAAALRGRLTRTGGGVRVELHLRVGERRRRRAFRLAAPDMASLHALHREAYCWLAAELGLPAPPPGSYLAYRLGHPLTDNLEAYRELVLGLRVARTPAEKLASYRRAAARDGRLGRAHRNIGYLLRQAGDLEGARMAYETAAPLLLHPEALGDVYFELGLVHAAAQRYGAAIRAWKQSLRFVPARREAFYNIGLAYEELGRKDRAVTYYERAHRADPTYLSPLEGLFRLHIQDGSYGAAAAVLKKWLRITPHDPSLHRILGHCYRKEGRKGEALRHLRKAVELDPDGEVGREARRDLLDL